jgi:eukaryotic translation initiation factor 2-alpha kinase 4
MNYSFSTGAERIAVIEDLRKKDIVFPVDWEIHRTRQRQSMIFPLSTPHPTNLYFLVITWLLKHNPDERPTALELSQSSLLPPRLEDEYFKGALKMMSKLQLVTMQGLR